MRYTIHIIKEKTDKFDYKQNVKDFVRHHATKPYHLDEIKRCLYLYCDRNHYRMDDVNGDLKIFTKSMVTHVHVIDID